MPITAVTFQPLLRGSRVRACRQQMSPRSCLLHLACDLLRGAEPLGYLCRALPPSAAPKVFLPERRVKIYGAGGHGHISDGWVGGKGVCVHSHSGTHTSRPLPTCLSAGQHTHAHVATGGGGKVAGHGWGQQWCDRRTGTRYVCACVCVMSWCAPAGVAGCSQPPVNNVVKKGVAQSERVQQTRSQQAEVMEELHC